MDAAELDGIVRIDDVDRAEILGGEAWEALFVDGQPEDLFGLEVRRLGIDLLLVRIDGVEGEILGFEQREDFFVQVEEDFVEVRSG